jgi:hypothetical protein
MGLVMKSTILKKIDKGICSYLGLEKSAKTSADSVSMRQNDITITTNESHKRHLLQKEWAQFASTDLKDIDEDNKRKLGIALGKAIAQDLVISLK